MVVLNQKSGDFTRENNGKPLLKWDDLGDTPILGNTQMVIFRLGRSIWGVPDATGLRVTCDKPRATGLVGRELLSWS